jgi:hypothetical protein
LYFFGAAALGRSNRSSKKLSETPTSTPLTPQ